MIPWIVACLVASVLIPSCRPRDQGTKVPAYGPAQETALEAKGADPRAAFESSGMVGGLTASLEAPVALVPPSGKSEAGVALALGGALSTAAIVRSSPTSESSYGRPRHELVLASGAKAALPGPALAIASSGDRLVLACADRQAPEGGVLVCFKIEGEGEGLSEAWKRQVRAVNRLVAIPGGRVALADDLPLLPLPRISCVDAVTGEEVWAASSPAQISDLAYAPGLVLAAEGTKLVAMDESTGAQVWSAAQAAKTRALAAGNGVAIVIAETGSLSAFSLADGKGIGAAPGPFDPAVRPVADGNLAIAATVGGGAAELEVSSGQIQRSWSWRGSPSFLIADRERIYAGVQGLAGVGIFLAGRAGDADGRLLRLGSGAFGAPVAVNGSRGGLLVLQLDGSLVLVGKGVGASSARSALEEAIRPKAETAAAISAALGRFKPAEAQDADRYLRFDLFAQGMPVDSSVAFTAFAYDPESSGRRTFAAKPPVDGAVVAIYSEEGRELSASIDELGSASSASAYFKKGKRYWIAAGWTYKSETDPFRVFLR